MEQRSTKVILAIALLCVWGLLGYRVYHKLYPSNDFFIPPNNYSIGEETVALDSFSLKVDYRDPFLDEKLRVPQVTRQAAAPRLRDLSVRRSVKFPKVSYKGSIELKTGRKVAVLSIDQQIINLGLGEKAAALQLVDLAQDSVRLKYAGQIKTFFKAKPKN